SDAWKIHHVVRDAAHRGTPGSDRAARTPFLSPPRAEGSPVFANGREYHGAMVSLSAEMSPLRPDRNLALELVRATEAAAIRAVPFIGRGDKNAADKAAVDAMRKFLGTV